MLSIEDRQTLREVIVARASEEYDGLKDELSDPETLYEWLQDKLSIHSLSAATLAYAREDTLFEDDVAELADHLGFDEGLLKALVSEASYEVLDHAVVKALGLDMTCEQCADFVAHHSRTHTDDELKSLALDVLGHVYANPASSGDPLTDDFMNVWRQLDEGGRLRVFAQAVEERERRALRVFTLTDIVHQWYYTHLPLPLRQAAVAMHKHDWKISARTLEQEVPNLRGTSQLTAVQSGQRIMQMFHAAEARLSEAMSISRFEPIVTLQPRGRGQQLVVSQMWRDAIAQLLRIEQSRS